MPRFFRRTLPCLVLVAATAPKAVTAQRSQDKAALFQSICWEAAPTIGHLGVIAQLTIPEQCRFTEASGARTFMEVTENPTNGYEQGVLLCRNSEETDPWFVLFRYEPVGYIKDDEGKSLDAAQLLSSIKQGTAAANERRRQKGWDTLAVEGWVREPYYDGVTHNLTWALQARSNGAPVVNHSVRLLGRSGVLHADLVTDPAQMVAVMTTFHRAIAGTTFVPGQTYAEWRTGDKVAAYGLTALVAGGAGAAAAKLGLFSKLWKLIAGLFVALWKLLVVAVVGVASWVRSLFKTKDAAPRSPTSPPTSAA